MGEIGFIIMLVLNPFTSLGLDQKLGLNGLSVVGI